MVNVMPTCEDLERLGRVIFGPHIDQSEYSDRRTFTRDITLLTYYHIFAYDA